MRVNDLDVHVEVEGAGPSLLVLHGFTGSTRSWDGVRSGLAEHARLVLVDLIGHGQSAAPEDAKRYTFAWCVRDLVSVLNALRLERVSVLGYSLGGRVALHLALAAPMRIDSLLLESASPGIADDAERAQRQQADAALAARIERHGIERFVAEWEAQPLLAPAPHIPASVRAARHVQRLHNRAVGLANSLRGMGAGRQASLWGQLATLRLPAHVLVGADDTRYCAIARRMQSQIADATLTEIPGAGHTVHLDQPAAFVNWTREAVTRT